MEHTHLVKGLDYALLEKVESIILFIYHHYLCQGGNVFAGFCLFVCLSLCESAR